MSIKDFPTGTLINFLRITSNQAVELGFRMEKFRGRNLLKIYIGWMAYLYISAYSVFLWDNVHKMDISSNLAIL